MIFAANLAGLTRLLCRELLSLAGRLRPYLAMVALGGGLLGVAGLVVLESRARALAEAGREVGNIAMVLAAHTERAIQSVELLQAALAERVAAAGTLDPAPFEALAREYPMHELLRERVRGLPQVQAMSLIDSEGSLLNISRGWPVPDLHLADRDYFLALRAPGGPVTFMGKPVHSRASGDRTVFLARRLATRDGRFLGLVHCALDLAYFERTFAGLALQPGSTVVLARSDGALLAQAPPEGLLVDAELLASEGFQSGLGEPAWLGGDAGRPARIVSTRALAGYPLRLSVSKTRDVALAEWRAEARMIGLGCLALLALLAGVAVLRGRGARARAQAQTTAVESARRVVAEKARREHDLREQHAAFRTAIEGMSQGLWMFGPDHRLRLANSHSQEILGLAPDALAPGPGPAEVMAAATLAGEPLAGLVHRLMKLVALGRRESFVVELSGGRAVAVGHQPLPDGGWIATFEDVTERRAAEARIAHMAQHDALTGLPNRVLLAERLRNALAEAAEARGVMSADAPGSVSAEVPGGNVAVLCLDIDQFKMVNETLGHAVGDGLLRAVTARLRARVREGDTVARLGGDEFAIIQRGGPQPEASVSLAGRVLAALAEPVVVDGHQLVVGASMGIALAPRDAATAEDLLKRADLALYRAKLAGRGQHAFFEPGMDEEVRARRRLETDLRRGLAEGEFELHYQPILETRTRRLAGFEALLRWRHPERGMVPPMEFIPLAEETGLINPLGEWVLRRACQDAAGWPDPVRVAVNLSPVQFRNAHLVGMVAEALLGSGLRPDLLELEITETVLLQDSESTLAMLHGLRGLGTRIALDDFGTGYSSLSYLRSFPFDKVKIDRSFVRDMERHADNLTIIRAVTELCRELGMSTTAEGVETESQLLGLEAIRCGEVQGYLFSKPRPAAEVPEMMASLRRRYLSEPAANVVRLAGAG